ncbi:ATP-binding protein [Lactobacillus sp. ESL0261]|uniref:ATP-binding protein n=1 Tax=Lactobacillus sp. ESL0261 TaxID=2069348 RepID=UPI001314C4CD|nr:DUF87 domain-containing protein [Lactobacillus sp. ESL0261]
MNTIEEETCVGFIIEITGVKVKARMLSNSNDLTYYKNGDSYRGVGIGEYVGIRRGPYKLVGKVEHEYLHDLEKDPNRQEFTPNRFIREVDISIVGAFKEDKFYFGITIFPQIFAEVTLLKSEEIFQVLTGNSKKIKFPLTIGKTIPEGINYSIDWKNFFNTHFAIFGNTGSGKSNTLAKLYSALFSKAKNEKWKIDNSNFIFLDFNGEYTRENALTNEKDIIYLDTSTKNGKDRISLPNAEFWDPEMLAILFSATKQTQEPFLRATLNYYSPQDQKISTDKMLEFIKTAFRQVFFGTYQNEKTLSLLKIVLNDIKPNYDKILPKKSMLAHWLNSTWNSTLHKYYFIPDADYINYSYNTYGKSTSIQKDKVFYFDSKNHDIFLKEVKKELEKHKIIAEENWKNSPLKLLSALVHLEMIYKLNYGDTQFDYVNPLLNRIESKADMFDKVIKITNDDNEDNITKYFCTVISLRNANRDTKDIIPLLVAKYIYQKQKRLIGNSEKINRTTHFVVDEAHNILSANNNREDDKWRDYRLDVFEEIIKEGRKFGFYLTIASQRPADISATIVSQMHNFIIHRLVNQNDLNMLSNTLNSLDRVSQSAIPTLAPGCAIFTGTSFQLPIMVKVDQLDDQMAPKSENAELDKVWNIPKDKS